MSLGLVEVKDLLNDRMSGCFCPIMWSVCSAFVQTDALASRPEFLNDGWIEAVLAAINAEESQFRVDWLEKRSLKVVELAAVQLRRLLRHNLAAPFHIPSVQARSDLPAVLSQLQKYEEALLCDTVEAQARRARLWVARFDRTLSTIRVVRSLITNLEEKAYPEMGTELVALFRELGLQESELVVHLRELLHAPVGETHG